MLTTPVLRPPLHLLKCSSLQHLVLLFLTAISSEQDNLIRKKKQQINIELWFEISAECNQLLVRLKPLHSILLFVTFFDNISYFSRNAYF